MKIESGLNFFVNIGQTFKVIKYSLLQKRSKLLVFIALITHLACTEQRVIEAVSTPIIMTVDGTISADSLGKTLIHEHVFLDWAGADSIEPMDWDNEAAFDVILPYLQEMKSLGVQSFLECTPNYLGRNPILLQKLTQITGLQILTNTGLYGARKNKFLPSYAFELTAEELAERWVQEFQEGIDGTKVRPGFIKIGVDADSILSDIHQKLVQAAGLTHLQTGLTIVAHTGPDAPALQEVLLLEELGVAPSAFVWTHAQRGTTQVHIKLAQKGTWVSLDGLGYVAPINGDSTKILQYVDFLVELKAAKLLHRTLISHDAGWYTHGDSEQSFTPYSTLFKDLLPLLEKNGFSGSDIQQLLIKNPKEAYQIRIRKL